MKASQGVKVVSGLFVAPAFILYTLLVIAPVLGSLYYSLTEWIGVLTPRFVGLQNYRTLLLDHRYWSVLRNTLVQTSFTLLLQVPLGLVSAWLLFRIRRGFKFFRTVLFLPVVIAPMAIGIMFSLFYNNDLGPLNKTLVSLGLGFLQRNWLSDSGVVLYSVMIPLVWQFIGLHMVILLAGLKTIPVELFESATVDGASSMRIFFSIVIPLLREVLIICVILATTGTLKSFEHSWSITRGGPGTASSFIATLMYKDAFLSNKYGYGSAISMTILFFAIVFTVAFRRLASRNAFEY